MPAVTNNSVLSVISNSANPSLDHPHRKSHEKTISGVFTYTNGTDAETGLQEHRLSQIKNIRSTSQNSSTYARAARDRSSNPESTLHEPTNLNSRSVESTTELASAEKSVSPAENGHAVHPGVMPTSITTNNLANIHQSLTTSPKEISPGTFDGAALSSSAPEITSPLSAVQRPSSTIDRRTSEDPSKPQEFPKLIHRHTLQIPRASMTRESRDFSMTSGPSEEVLTSTGRFSPTKDHDTTTRRRRASLGLMRRSTRTYSDAHIDEVPLDEDAARWTEVIKQKRASRRKRKEEEDDDRVVVGKKVDEGHVNWVTAYNMLTGIRFTVSRTNAKIDRELESSDFDAKHKMSFDVTGNELTPSAKYDFKFKDYSPWVFRHLRSMFGLDPADYLMSLTSKYILSELGSPGKSGSFFYFSRDYKYIIKTIHHAEHKLLRRVLRDYYAHVKNNPNTLISQFYGLHRVKIPYGRKIHFVVMNNLFPPHRDIHYTFDLKGSTIGRDYKEENLADNPRATLKDLNWLRRGLHLEFEQKIRDVFIEQLQRDVALLQRLHIMDYSLLVGMHDVEKGNDENLRETTLRVFQPGGEKDDDDIQHGLMRTASRLENVRKARELRDTLKREKPMPIGQMMSRMPDQMHAADERQKRIFYGDDGGIRAAHEDGQAGEMIYYLGVIDCLTHYGFVKRLEHVWKGLSNNSSQISPIPPVPYGERFLNFITGITMTKEEAARKSAVVGDGESVNAHNLVHHHHLPPADGTVENNEKEALVPLSSPRSPVEVEKTMAKAQKSTDKQTSSKGRKRSEDEDVPKKTLMTKTEDGRLSATLPMVQETGESSSEKSIKDEKRTSRSEPIDPSALIRTEAEYSNHDSWPHHPEHAHHHDLHTYSNQLLDTLHNPHRHDHHADNGPRSDVDYIVIDEAQGRPIAHATAPMSHANIIDETDVRRRISKPPRIASGIVPTVGSLFSDEEIGIAR